MQRIALGKMSGRRPSCRKMGAKTPESTIRGRSRRRTRYLGTFHLHRAQRKPRSKESPGCFEHGRDFPTCPAPSIWAFSDKKSDNMPSRNPKRDAGPSNGAPNSSAQTPNTQTIVDRPSARANGTNLHPCPKEGNEAKGHPPARVEPNSNALDKLSGPLARKSIIQAES